MATELGKAYIQIVPSAKGFSGSITKELSGEAGSAGKSLGGSLISSLKGVIAAAGIGKIIGDALSQGGQLEQSLGGVETLFKDSADKVKAYANEAYKTAGVSANEYMQSVTSFSASLLQSVSGDTDRAAEVANMAMIDMSDNANKMGSDMSSIQNAYQGFAKQNYTMLDNLKLGYGGTKTEMQRLLDDATKLSGVKYDISNLSDVYEAIHVIQGELGITGTTAKEAAETMEGSLNALKASFKDLLGQIAIGGDISQPLQGLGQSLDTFLSKNLFPMISRIVSQLPGAILGIAETALPNMIESGAKMVANIAQGLADGIPQATSQITNLAKNLASALSNSAPVLFEAAQNLLFEGLRGVEKLLPELLKVGKDIVTNIVGGMDNFTQMLGEQMDCIFSYLPSLISVILDALPALIEAIVGVLAVGIPAVIDVGIRLLSALVDGLPAIITTIVTAIPKIIESLIKALADFLPKIVDSGIKLLTALVKDLPTIINTIVAAIPQIIGSILQGIARSLPQIVKAGLELLVSLVKNLPSAIVQIVAVVPKIILGIVNAVREGIGQMVSVGGDLLRGLWDGISGAAGWLWDKVSGWASNLMADIKGFFGIHSPSKEFAWLGEMMDRGLGLGIADNVNFVSRAMDELEAETQRQFQADMDLAVRSSQGSLAASVASGITVSDSTQIAAFLSEILAAVRELELRGDVLLDGSELVGKLIHKVDESLSSKRNDDEFGGGKVAPVV